jgi:hypothetical protein
LTLREPLLFRFIDDFTFQTVQFLMNQKTFDPQTIQSVLLCQMIFNFLSLLLQCPASYFLLFKCKNNFAQIENLSDNFWVNLAGSPKTEQAKRFFKFFEEKTDFY